MSTPASREERARSFGSIADDYSRRRPGPPAGAAAWLLPAGARLAVDLGAGTGALSAALLATVSGASGPTVVAVEPDARMLSVLGRRLPGVGRSVGRAEAIPLRDRSADLVGVSSAWHWMDPDAVLPEVARVLRPGGVLGVLWGGPDRTVPWVAAVLERNVATTASRRGVRHRLVVPGSSAADDWDEPEEREFSGSVRYRVGDLVGLAASYSTVITLSDEDRVATLGRVAATVEAEPSLQGREWVEMPLRCRCWRVTRRG